MNRALNFLFTALLVSVFSCAPGWAQTSTAQINGTVRDQSGAVLPGADVTATQVATGAKRSAVTNETGSYTLTNLPIGPYTLEVALPGFRTYVQSGIVLQVSDNPVINAILQVGQVSETVEVQANATLVETRSTGVGQVIDNQRVLELPLNGRQATELIFLAGMATPTTGAGLVSNVRNYPTVAISVAGGLATGMTYVLDGGTHNDPYNNLNLPLPFPDALQEFKVETSALPAQYGHHSSAAVNAVTKSGTNDYHGDLFEFVRNGAFNARNAFALTRDNLKRNQFGGTIGGPILRNKLFFFAGNQTTIQRSTPTDSISFIPTPAMLTGDFTAVTAPACNTANRQINLAAPFANNRISPSSFSPAAMAILKQPGFPTTADPCGTFRYGRKAGSNEYITLGRVDYQASSQHSLFGRYLNARFDQPTDFDPKNLLALLNATLAFRVHSFVLGDTYLIGSNTVNNFRATLNRSVIPKFPPQFFSSSDVGVNTWVAVPKYMRLSVTNGFNIGGAGSTPSTYNTTSFQFSEDLSLVRGRHQIGAGANWIHGELNGVSRLNATGPFTFNGQVTGLGLADFMVGKPSALTQSNEAILYYRGNYFGLYLQDAWKATQRLTINAGLRWDPYLPPHTKNGGISNFDPARFAAGSKSTIYKNAPAGLAFPGDAAFPGKAAGNKDWMNLAPRIGIAWDPKGDGQFSVRAAYGLFYDLQSLNYYIGFAQGSPFGSQVTLNFPPSFENPWSSYPGGNPFPVPVNSSVPFNPFASYETLPFNARSTYAQQWNLSLQKQIGTDWLAQANYIGSETVHVWTGNQVNPGVFLGLGSCTINGQTFNPCSTTANVDRRRKLYLQDPVNGQYYSSISALDDGGTASYHGLLLSLQRRAARGLTVSGNYTLAHCISDLANAELAVAGVNYMIPDNRRSSRGNCLTADRRHNFNLSTVYQTPQFSAGTMRALASGWQLSSIVRLRGGEYLSITSGFDQALTGAAAQRVDQVLASPYSDVKNVDHWFNSAAFAQPVLGTYGNMGGTNALGPGLIQIDMGVTRSFKVRENQSLQFRAEAFNLPNHMNPMFSTTNPTTAINSTLFGKILTAGDPRILQFALKYVF